MRCYFRFDSSLPFIYSEMKGTNNNLFTTKLPLPISTVKKIEYLFLVVNDQKQAIISQNFTLTKKSINKISSTDAQNNSLERYQLKSELVGADTVKKFFLHPANIKISLVLQQLHYGVLAGLYSREQLDSEVVAGYFGAFRLDPKKGMIAVKGYIITPRSSDLSVSQEQSTVAKETIIAKEEFAFDIAGDSWTGFFWRSDNYSRTVVPLTAIVTQSSDGRLVTITTSMEGLGHYFAGNMFNNGYMLLYDAYDGEDWTTHYGPPTDFYIKIADYVRPPSEDDPFPPLNIIEMTRSSKPKAPVFIPGISLLLL